MENTWPHNRFLRGGQYFKTKSNSSHFSVSNLSLSDAISQLNMMGLRNLKVSRKAWDMTTRNDFRITLDVRNKSPIDILTLIAAKVGLVVAQNGSSFWLYVQDEQVAQSEWIDLDSLFQPMPRKIPSLLNQPILLPW